jgi:mono/diheme cytochrome c family protein
MARGDWAGADWAGRGATALAILLSVAALGAFAEWAYQNRYRSLIYATQRSDAPDVAMVERGRYLVDVADCAGCHSNPGDIPFAGGRRIETPLGSIVATNITPDAETGIGLWSDEAFDAALRQGRQGNGAPLYPAMPYVYYAKMSSDDVRAIRAYLSTLAPAHRQVEPNHLAFPFSLRPVMALWNAVYFRPEEFQALASKSPEWNRGAYLVEGPAHCGACHTPKNRFGADENAEEFAGYAAQGWYAPNIGNDKSLGLGDWSEADIVAYLKTGHNRLTAATGSMAEVVSDSTSHLSDADLRAMADFLLDPPAKPGQQQQRSGPAALVAASFKAGEAVYHDECSSCHGLDGVGVPALLPNLAASTSLRANDTHALIRILLLGGRSATDGPPAMPAFGRKLNDAQVAAVLTYTRQRWNAPSAPVSAEEVGQARRGLMQRGD